MPIIIIEPDLRDLRDAMAGDELPEAIRKTQEVIERIVARKPISTSEPSRPNPSWHWDYYRPMGGTDGE